VKKMIDYLNLDETEYELAKQMDALPREVLDLFIKLINSKRSEFEAVEQEIRAYAEQYRKEHRQ